MRADGVLRRAWSWSMPSAVRTKTDTLIETTFPGSVQVWLKNALA